MRTEKLLLIYRFSVLEESNTKLIQDICERGNLSAEKGRDFRKYTVEENEKFLRKWYKDNKIRMKDYKIYEDMTKAPKDKNGLPIIIRRVPIDDIKRKN